VLIWFVQDEQLTTSYRTETQAKLKQAEDFNPDHPRVFHSNRCTMCRESLTLPAVHFMCNHSYHQKCVLWFPPARKPD
jgi:hypothetical protein